MDQTLARLHAALDSVELSNTMIGEIRQGESFRSERAELRTAAELVARARELLRRLIRSGA